MQDIKLKTTVRYYFKSKHLMNKTKLLIIRFSSIGDIVLTTPVLRCLKKQLGSSVEIHYLTKKQFANILQANSYIDKVIVLDKKLKDVISDLKQHDYDYIIDLHNNLRSALVKIMLQKNSYSFNKLNFKKWLMVNLKINYLPDIHIVERYMKTVDFLNIKYDGQGLDYYLDETEEVQESELSEELQNGFIVFVIGGKHHTKRFPDEKIISICNKINYPIILLGGREDEASGNQIASACKKNVYNKCGKYSLNKSASLIKQSQTVITHDTGLMHIAAACRKPIISIWGNTVPAFGMYPFLPDDLNNQNLSKIVEIKNLACRPCSKIGYKKCPKKHFQCMNDINEEEIIEFVNKNISSLTK